MGKTQKKTQKKTQRKTYFWKIYGIVVMLVLGVIASGSVVLWKFLKAYEQSQPEYAVEDVIEKFEQGNISNLKQYITYEHSEFETEEVVDAYLTSKTGAGNWSYSKSIGEWTKDSPVYDIKKDGAKIAVIRFSMKSERAEFNTPQWELSAIDQMIDESNENNYVITVPQGASVFVNGVSLSSDYITADSVECNDLGNVTKYITAPTKTTYTVNGILGEPEITATGELYGSVLQQLSSDPIKDSQQASAQTSYLIEFGFESNDTLLNEQQQRIMDITKIYGNYVTADATFAQLSPYIMSGSYAYSYLKNIASTNKWFSSHSGTYFQNMSVYNFQNYTDTCFSCEVSFEQIVTRSSQEYSYPTHISYVFIKKGNSWYVADISLK